MLDGLAADKAIVTLPFSPPISRTLLLLCQPHLEGNDVTRTFLQITKTYLKQKGFH